MCAIKRIHFVTIIERRIKYIMTMIGIKKYNNIIVKFCTLTEHHANLKKKCIDLHILFIRDTSKYSFMSFYQL